MDGNEKLTFINKEVGPRLPLLSRITREVVISYVAALVSVFAVYLFYCVFSIKNMNGTLYYLGKGTVRWECGPAVPEWVDYLFLILLVTVFVLKVAFWFFMIADRVENGRQMWKRVLLKVFAGAVALFIGSYGLFRIQDYREYVNYGTDRIWNAEYYIMSHENRSIIIREATFLFAGGAEIYQLMEDDSLIKIGYIGTDDGFRYRGNYHVIWEEDGVKFEYTFNSIPMEVFCRWVD